MVSETIVMRDDSSVMDVRLGRLREFDPLSRKFSVREIPGIKVKTPRSYTWAIKDKHLLDQGDCGSCVSHGFSHELSSRPIIRPTTHDEAMDFQRNAVQRDEFDGDDPCGGTSLLAVVKELTARGFYKEYRWAFSEKDMALAVGYAGPVVIGVNWYTGMFNPDRLGYIIPSGWVAGGHCVMVNAISVRLNRYQIVNSWGIGWGNLGRAFITREDMAQLLHEQGECCLPMRVKIK